MWSRCGMRVDARWQHSGQLLSSGERRMNCTSQPPERTQITTALLPICSSHVFSSVIMVITCEFCARDLSNHPLLEKSLHEV